MHGVTSSPIAFSRFEPPVRTYEILRTWSRSPMTIAHVFDENKELDS